MALPSEWMDKTIPMEGQLLVQRVRQGYIWEGIIQIPDSYTGFTKNANAVVVDFCLDHQELPELEIGDVVWVAQGVTRKITYVDDFRDDTLEPALYACYPNEIIMNLGKLEKPEPVALEESRRGRWHTESGLDKALQDRRADEAG